MISPNQMEKSMKGKHYAISHAVAQAIADYLQTRPYSEVQAFMSALAQLPELKVTEDETLAENVETVKKAGKKTTKKTAAKRAGRKKAAKLKDEDASIKAVPATQELESF